MYHGYTKTVRDVKYLLFFGSNTGIKKINVNWNRQPAVEEIKINNLQLNGNRPIQESSSLKNNDDK